MAIDSIKEKLNISKISRLFLFYSIEGDWLYSGNIWGTAPGRVFCLHLLTLKFFDTTHPRHSGRGIKQLCWLRGEPVPAEWRLTYDKFKQRDRRAERAQCRERGKPVYIEGPLETIPIQMTPPGCVTVYEPSGKVDIEARLFAYHDALGRLRGYVASGVHRGRQTRWPLSVWRRLVGPGETLLSYRKRLFHPIWYQFDHIVSRPDATVCVCVDEEQADRWSTQQSVGTCLPPGGLAVLASTPGLSDALADRLVVGVPGSEADEEALKLYRRYLKQMCVVSYEKWASAGQDGVWQILACPEDWV